MQKKTIRELVLEFFYAHPNEDMEHDPVVDWVTEQRVAMGYNPPRDVWRMVRQLHADGILVNPSRGVYKYDPDYVHDTDLQDFSPAVKRAIFEKNNYRCVVCGLGREDGVRIAADHKKPKSKGGDSSVENGQTLCYQHNSMKKDYGQTTAGKRYFIEIYNTAVENQDKKMIAFCQSVFDAYDEHDMNGHIERPDRNTSLF